MDAEFTSREAQLAFAASRMWVTDLVRGYHQDRLLNFVDFLEVRARLRVYVSVCVFVLCVCV